MRADDRPVLFTLGHSNKPLDHFLSLLRAHGIQRVRDVRSVPESAHVPHFGSRVLPLHLERAGIEYCMDGTALGGHPAELRLYREDGRVDFRQLESEHSFRKAITSLRDSVRDRRTALICKEADPFACPRFFLLGRLLKASGVSVFHILQDGSLFTQDEGEQRILETTGLAAADLFSTPTERLDQAYEILMDRYDHRWRDPQPPPVD